MSDTTTLHTAHEVLEATTHLSATIAARAAEIERGRRVPRDLLDALLAAGCFSLFRPASHGGAEADLPTGLHMIESLACADASTAWVVLIGSLSWCDLTGLPRAAFDDLFASESDGIIAGAFNPTGTIAAVDGNYRVTGRWAFASGCEHADWIYGNCVESVVDGVPNLRVAVFSPDQVVIEDTWDVIGLSGTGSHHFHADNVVVPQERTCIPMSDTPCLDDPITHIPIPALVALGIASVAVGTAQGAVDDIVELAADTVPLLAHEPLAANPLFQQELARANAELQAGRALLRETAASMWDLATSGSTVTMLDRARARAAAVWIAERAAAVVEMAYRSGGASALYSDSSLQRRLRDMYALNQHFILRRDTLTTSGAILAGVDVDVLLF